MATGSIIIEDQVRIPSDVFDLEGFRRWASSDEFPERGRFSFIAGQVEVDMSPEELQSHNRLKTALTIQLGNFAAAQDSGEILSDGASCE